MLFRILSSSQTPWKGCPPSLCPLVLVHSCLNQLLFVPLFHGTRSANNMHVVMETVNPALLSCFPTYFQDHTHDPFWRVTFTHFFFG